ncbi:unnamed protein product [Cladocopium goreaui]|uniref:Leucine-rich repeat protein SHOC-2 n=1 Tax=Cladocopium goreaui TaxID=2562237 RepID=A0A9P1GMI6_9DINO|nr:unnamed protein product [Cladocopium goreaui]
MRRWLLVLPLLFGSPCAGDEAQACMTARVISVGTADPWDAGQVRILTDNLPIFRFVPRRGVNVVALGPKDGTEVLLNRTYGPQEASAKDLEKDLDDLPPHTVILVALLGMSHQAYLEPLSKIQATLFPAISPEQGYALIGSKGRVPLEHVGSQAREGVDIVKCLNMVRFGCCWWVLVGCLAAVNYCHGSASAVISLDAAPVPDLPLDDFEDDDCIESQESDLLLWSLQLNWEKIWDLQHLMHELGGVLEQVLLQIEAGVNKEPDSPAMLCYAQML